eukprot:TRINITY_DN3463_c0_g1_i1.p1 TRINITY_DN3463_c0_g1~~TRINITY_DN3463_c0_g1_i1.p1  ORF type:complete len:97 (+),score=18.89 TRINITY_DN3463_c0_g1_i1:116-406(+)
MFWLPYLPHIFRPGLDSSAKSKTNLKDYIAVIKYLIEEKEFELKEKFMSKGHIPPYYYEISTSKLVYERPLDEDDKYIIKTLLDKKEKVPTAWPLV